MFAPRTAEVDVLELVGPWLKIELISVVLVVLVLLDVFVVALMVGYN